jgi:hypothetical protein
MTSWNDPASWVGGVVPGPADDGEIIGTVTVSGNVACCKLVAPVGTTLVFDPTHSTKITACGSVIMEGTLQWHPANASIVHEILFVGIDESLFVGGTVDPHTNGHSDIGLWVMGAGHLDIIGTTKTTWVRNNTGWDATWATTDRTMVVPTVAGDYGTAPSATTGFRPFAKNSAVPAAIKDGVTYRAEVFNLTHNCRIGGTGDGGPFPATNGRTHIMIMSSVPQMVKNLYIHDVGPRKLTGNATFPTDVVLGRWGLHFHLCGDASRGSVIENVVVERCGSHAFVPHKSHGVTFKNCVAFDCWDASYWWDADTNTVLNQSDDTVLDHCAAFLNRCHPLDRGFGNAGFWLGYGRGNVCKDCVAVGTLGGSNGSAAGFAWPDIPDFRRFLTTPPQDSNPWDFHDNLAHNCPRNGIFVWNNSGQQHHVVRFVSYRTGSSGINHGAYTNCYSYEQCRIYEPGSGGIALAAISHPDHPTTRLQLIGCIVDGGPKYPIGFPFHTATGLYVLITNCTFRSTTLTAANINERPDVATAKAGKAFFSGCTFNGQPMRTDHVQMTGMHAASSYVVGPPTGTPQELTAPWHPVPPGWVP